MSHFTKVTTKINHLPSLFKALDKLGVQYAVGSDKLPARVRGYVHQEITADVAINLGKYDLGVVRNAEGGYDLAGDWWGIETTTGRTEREIIDEIAREYSLARVTLACQENGYDFEGEPVVSETGEIELQAVAWN